jgi:poly(hydroxyalkanoate) depolymerase family esterase
VSKPGTARKSATPAPSAIGKGSWRQARFTGAAGTRAYRVYVPTGLGRTRKVPMLLALHGCGQNALDFAAGTRFNDLADKHKFIVVYPEQGVTHNGQRCWNWFRSGHQFRAQGEPAILAGIVRRVSQDTAKWRIDTERIYVAGISAGGAMAVVLAATYPELFAAIGVHSAPPYRSASGPVDALAAMQGRTLQSHVENVATAAMPPMIVFHGSADSTVRSVNAQRVADQWVAFHDHDGAAALGRPRSASTAPGRPGSARSRRGYRVSRWYSGGHKVLEVWLVTGLGHAWSGGSPKGSYSDSRGPRATTEMWKFFAANRAAAVNAEIRVS